MQRGLGKPETFRFLGFTELYAHAVWPGLPLKQPSLR
jgi:hypothetical protein